MLFLHTIFFCLMSNELLFVQHLSAWNILSWLIYFDNVQSLTLSGMPHPGPHLCCNGLHVWLECGRLWIWALVWLKLKTIVLVFDVRALRNKSNYWFVQNQDNLSKWSNMFTHGLLYQWARHSCIYILLAL